MSSKTVVETLCDVCLNEGNEVEGEPTPLVTIGKAAPRRVDLCVQHKVDLFDPFVSLIRSGRVEGAAASLVAPREATVVELPTNVCEDCSRTFDTPAGLKRHRTTKHRRKAG